MREEAGHAQRSFPGWPALVAGVAILVVTAPCAAQEEAHRAIAIYQNAKSDRDVRTALELFQKAARKNPKNLHLWEWIGQCLYDLGAGHEALAAFQRGAALGETWQNQFGVGRGLYQQGRLEEAVRHLQKAVALQPNQLCLAGLGRTLHELGRDDEATPLLERLVRDMAQLREEDRKNIEKNWSDPLTVLMECYAAKGMYAEAAAIFRERRAAGMAVEQRADGLLVRRVITNMPAEQAGIRPGDLLVRWSGMPLAALSALRFEQTVGSAALGQRLPVELMRGGQIQKVEVRMEFNANATPLRGSLAVKVQRLEVRPARIMAGAPFEVDVYFVVSDPAVGSGTVAVDFSFRILEDQKVLFTKPPVKLDGPDGAVRRRTEQLIASPRKGRYTFQASLHYSGLVAEESVEFQVE